MKKKNNNPLVIKGRKMNAKVKQTPAKASNTSKTKSLKQGKAKLKKKKAIKKGGSINGYGYSRWDRDMNELENLQYFISSFF